MSEVDKFHNDFSSLPTFVAIEMMKKVGAGAYGAVFEAKVDSLKKPVICKRLHDILIGLGEEEEVSVEERKTVVRKFVKECVLLSRLKHRNIVYFYGINVGSKGEELGDINLIMESLSYSLYQVCVRSSLGLSEKLTFIRKLAILRDVSCGMNFMHKSNIIHRDLNAGNVLLTENLLLAKVADLGCSKLVDRIDLSQKLSSCCPGAVSFMPPEVLQQASSHYNSKLDCFSFGHLALFLWNQKEVILSGTLSAEELGCQQIGLRKQYFDCLKNHRDLKMLISECLSDKDMDRPSSKRILEKFNFKMGGCLLSSSSIDLCTPNVIAVDFGISMLRIAYRIGGAQIIDLAFDKFCSVFGIPNVLLITSNQKQEVSKFKMGYDALSEFHQNAYNTSSDLCFQFPFKDLDTFVEASNGHSYSTAEVIAAIFMHIKSNVQSYFEARGKEEYVKTFHWILSIPDGLGGTIRKAAYLAGLFDHDALLCLPLVPVNIHNASRDLSIEASSQKIHFIPKAEAAIAAIIHEQYDSIPTDSCILLVDVGKGKIETSAVVIDKGIHEVLKLPHIEDNKGGYSITDALLEYLAQEIIYDEKFQKYLNHEDKILHYADFHVSMRRSLECAIIEFASTYSTVALPAYVTIQLPPSFLMFYKDQLELLDENSPVHLGKQKQALLLSYTKLDDFMVECFARVKKAIDNALLVVGDRPVDAIYLAGGLGGSQYMVDNVRSSFSFFPVRLPENPTMASVHGACHYFDSFLIHFAHFTYGIECSVPYDYNNQLHQQAEKLLSDEDEYYCSSLFVPLLHKGDRIDPHKLYGCVIAPMYHEQSVIAINLYSTNIENPTFVVDKKTGNCLKGMNKIASLDVDIEDGIETSLKRKLISVTVQFERQEILLSAEYNGCNKKTTICNYTVCDYEFFN